jgi:SAM-dependent methyltransferase
MTTAEFDRVADVYDETRRALDEETLAGIKEMLVKYGCHAILEIGVGTGRVSSPLMKSGYDMTGVDVSRRMMEKARSKSLTNLVLGDGRNAPFRENSFDATLMAHVFHLLEDPLLVMREGARVGRVGVFALVRKWPGNRPWFSMYGGQTSPDGSNIDTPAMRRLQGEHILKRGESDSGRSPRNITGLGNVLNGCEIGAGNRKFFSRIHLTS